MRKILAVLMSLCLLTACEKNENENNGNELDGVWYLKNVTCLCPPANFQGTHRWYFDTDKFAVTVTNNPDEDMQILSGGIYPYSISATKITIDSVTYDYYFLGEKLILAHKPEVDGPYLEFERY